MERFIRATMMAIVIIYGSACATTAEPEYPWGANKAPGTMDWATGQADASLGGLGNIDGIKQLFVDAVRLKIESIESSNAGKLDEAEAKWAEAEVRLALLTGTVSDTSDLSKTSSVLELERLMSTIRLEFGAKRVWLVAKYQQLQVNDVRIRAAEDYLKCVQKAPAWYTQLGTIIKIGDDAAIGLGGGAAAGCERYLALVHPNGYSTGGTGGSRYVPGGYIHSSGNRFFYR